MRLSGVFAVLFAFLPICAFSLSIEYVPPTPANNSILPAGYATVNVTIDQDVESCTLHWNKRIAPRTPYVWVGVDTKISSINASDGNVTGNYSLGSTFPRGVAVDALGHVWTGNYFDTPGSASCINASNGNLIGTYEVPGKVQCLTADALGQIWAGIYGGNVVSRVNASNGNVTGNYTVRHRPWGVAADALGNIWVANSGITVGETYTVSRVNASNGNVTGNYTVKTMPTGIAADALGNVWVTSSDHYISRVNATNGNVSQNVTTPYNTLSVAADGLGNIWVTAGTHTISRINASTGDVTGNYTIPTSIGYGYGVSADALGNIWVSSGESGIPADDNIISRVNASNGNVTGNYTVLNLPFGCGDMTGFALQNFVLNQYWHAYPMTVVNAGAGTFAYYTVTGLVDNASYQYYVECTADSGETNSTPPNTVTALLANVTISPDYKAFPQGTGSYSVQFTPTCTLSNGSAVACPPLNWTTNLTGGTINATGFLTLPADAIQGGAVNASFYNFSGPYSDADVPLSRAVARVYVYLVGLPGNWCPLGYYSASVNASSTMVWNTAMNYWKEDAPMRFPQIAFNGSGNVPHVTFFNTGGILYEHYWNGARWAAESGNTSRQNSTPGYVVSKGNDTAQFFMYRMGYSVAVDSKGQPHVAGIYATGAANGFDQEVFYLFWNATANNWTNAYGGMGEDYASNVSNMPFTNSTSVSLVLDGEDQPHIAWTERNFTILDPVNNVIRVRVLYRYWNKTVRKWLDASGSEGMDNIAALNVSKTKYALDYDQTTSQLPEAEPVSLALDSKGQPHIVWSDRSGKGENCWHPCFEATYRWWNNTAQEWVDPLNDTAKITDAGNASQLDMNNGWNEARQVKLALGPVGAPNQDQPFVAFMAWQRTSSHSPQAVLVKKWDAAQKEWTDMAGNPNPYSEEANASKGTVNNAGVGRPYILGLSVDYTGFPHVSYFGNVTPGNSEILYRRWNGFDWVDAQGKPGVTTALNVSADGNANNYQGGEMRLNSTGPGGVPFVVYSNNVNSSYPSSSVKHWLQGDSCPELKTIAIPPDYRYFQVNTAYAVQYQANCMLSDGSQVVCPPLNWTTNLTGASINATGYLIGNTPDLGVYAVNASFYSFAEPYNPADVPLVVNSSWVEIGMNPAAPSHDAPNAVINVHAASSDTTVTLDGLSSRADTGYSIALYSWTMHLPGSGCSFTNSTGNTTDLVCPTSGAYTVRLTVTDDDAAFPRSGTAVKSVWFGSGGPGTPGSPAIQTAGIILLSCPNIAPANETNVTVQCMYRGQPCNANDIHLAGGRVISQYLQGTGGFIYTIDTRLAGGYSLTASYFGLGSSTCKFTRVRGRIATNPLPDFNPILAVAVAASALLLARRRIRR